MTGKSPVLSVISPVYMGGGILPVLAEKLHAELYRAGIDYELILVDDASPDNAWTAIEKLSAQYPVTGIQLSHNVGQHAAIYYGLKQAAGNWICIIDCDLQDNPTEIPVLLQAGIDNNSSVLAHRLTKKNRLYYVVSSYLLNKLLSWITGFSFDYRTGNFGVFTRNSIRQVLCKPLSNNFYFPVAIRRVEPQIPALNVQHQSRYVGKSSYTFIKQWKLACKALRYAFQRGETAGLPNHIVQVIYGRFEG